MRALPPAPRRTRPLAPCLLVLGALALGVPATAAPAAVAPMSSPRPSTAPWTAQQPGGGDTTVAAVSPELGGVPVVGGAAERAQAAFDAAQAQLEAAVAARIAAEAELATLATREVDLTAAIAARTTTRKDAAAALVVARQQFQAAAVASYVVSTDQSEVTRVFDTDSSVEIGQLQTYSDTVREERYQDAERAAGEVERASRRLDRAQLERIEVRDRTVVVTAAQQQAAADEAARTAEVAELGRARDRARATSQVRGVDFSLVALDAYYRAAGSQASCGIEWWALAGISRVEGRHGTYGGAQLLANGDLSKPIIGIALTGGGATAFIGDSDGGALDGDPVYDRAVGPMQFIPTTWARWKQDGDGDGDTDPQSLYDATAAAAAYLCHERRLDTEAGLRAGYFSYNHSEAYVSAVLGHAYQYRELVIPPPPR